MKTITKEIFFFLLSILLFILVYGSFKQNPGLGFFAPHWKLIDLLLIITVFFGILGIWNK